MANGLPPLLRKTTRRLVVSLAAAPWNVTVCVSGAKPSLAKSKLNDVAPPTVTALRRIMRSNVGDAVMRRANRSQAPEGTIGIEYVGIATVAIPPWLAMSI